MTAIIKTQRERQTKSLKAPEREKTKTQNKKIFKKGKAFAKQRHGKIIMTGIKKLFQTPKKAAITIICIIAIVAAVGIGGAFAAGAIAQSSSIGEDHAKNFAFADAGVDPASAQNVRVEFDYERGQFVYEVEFVADGVEYEYRIKASDGSVVKKEVDLADENGIPSGSKVGATISIDEAKNIAITDAGLTASEVTITKAKLDKDDGVAVYEIEFYTDTNEYEYEINASTGKVHSKDVELRKSGSTPDTNSEKDYIGIENAKQKALADAGLTASQVTFTKQKLDKDNGRAIYEIEFYTADNEYDYDIDALTGNVVEKSIEKRNNSGTDNPGTTQPENFIGLESAKGIALSDAKLTDKDVTFTKTKLDKDDGRYVYEIEFYSTSNEYDYEIDALTGEVLSCDVEYRGNTGAGNEGSGNQGGTQSYIGIDAAKEVALKDAGLTAAQVTFTKQKLDKDDGIDVYEIEFFTETAEYDYEINAATGAVHSKDVDLRPNGTTDPATPEQGGSQSYIGLESAKAKALADAKLTATDVTFTKARLDKDDGRDVYEIEFYTTSNEYDYDIDALTGEILSRDIEARPNSGTGSGGSGNQGGAQSYIGIEAAKAAALKDAGLTAAEVTFTQSVLDIDDGIAVYEIDFYTSKYEYEYEINAINGAVHSKDAEQIKSTVPPSDVKPEGGDTYIGMDRAKEIALNHAGFSSSTSGISFKKVKLERDDGVMVYEVEFYKGGVEYEYTINALNGNIIDHEIDYDD